MRKDLQAAREKLNSHLGFNVYRLYLIFRRELMRALRDHQLNPEQWEALGILWEFGKTTPSEISQVTLQDRPSVSRMLRRMEKNGWVQRADHQADGRSFHVELTARGRELYPDLRFKLQRHFQRYMHAVPAEVEQKLVEQLRDLRLRLGDLSLENFLFPAGAIAPPEGSHGVPSPSADTPDAPNTAASAPPAAE